MLEAKKKRGAGMRAGKTIAGTSLALGRSRRRPERKPSKLGQRQGTRSPDAADALGRRAAGDGVEGGQDRSGGLVAAGDAVCRGREDPSTTHAAGSGGGPSEVSAADGEAIGGDGDATGRRCCADWLAGRGQREIAPTLQASESESSIQKSQDAV